MQSNNSATVNEENKNIFVSCFNNETGAGGTYFLDDNSLLPIYEGTGCYGIFVDRINKILFCTTRTEPQIIAFRIIAKNKFEKIPIKFENYEFANDAHGIWVAENKLFLVGSEGEKNGQLSKNDHGPGKHVGKIIISEIKKENNFIKIQNSKISNPFNCLHHHHINDLCMIGNKMYLSSFSFCDSNKNFINSGVISELDELGNANVLIRDLEKPHSIAPFKDRVFICSSSASKILSFNVDDKTVKLEHKTIDAFVRGLLITEKFMYYGISAGIGRTASQFTNKDSILFRFNKSNDETKKIPIPSFCDNIYGIDSD